MRSILLLLSLLTLGPPITAQQTDSLLVARPLDQLERLQQRARVINQLAKEEKAAYQRCIEIHLDSRSQNKQLDVFFYHHARSKKGRDMAETLRNIRNFRDQQRFILESNRQALANWLAEGILNDYTQGQ